MDKVIIEKSSRTRGIQKSNFSRNNDKLQSNFRRNNDKLQSNSVLCEKVILRPRHNGKVGKKKRVSYIQKCSVVIHDVDESKIIYISKVSKANTLHGHNRTLWPPKVRFNPLV